MQKTYDNEPLSHRLKSLWGATAMPFAKEVKQAFVWSGSQQAQVQLQRLVELRSSGVFIGKNGVGKSFLAAEFFKTLPTKAYFLISINHTSISGSDLIRSLTFALGKKPLFRRADTIQMIHETWSSLDGRFPLLCIDEAQNLSAIALEELRLISAHALDTKTLFSLILIGDESLLAGWGLTLMSACSVIKIGLKK